jgi:hypothetical protein
MLVNRVYIKTCLPISLELEVAAHVVPSSLICEASDVAKSTT